MFSKLAVVFVSAAAIVSALPGDPATDAVTTTNIFNKTTNKCNVGTLSCCKSVNKASTNDQQTLSGILGAALGSVPIGVGVTCNPISVLAAGVSSNCNAQPACCNGNNANGLGTAACVPVNLSL